jgi:hypothetical protein
MMKKSRSIKRPAKHKQNSARLSKTTLAILFGVIAAISVTVISLAAAGSSNPVAASAKLSQATEKRYKATRPIVVDQQTGRLRMPTKQEVNEVLGNLATLAKRESEGLQQTSLANGGVAVDLEGGFGGVVLARPTADGGWETRCVFTFEEGVEFLGLQEDNSQQ